MKIDKNLDEKLESLNEQQLSFIKDDFTFLVNKLIQYCNTVKMIQDNKVISKDDYLWVNFGRSSSFQEGYSKEGNYFYGIVSISIYLGKSEKFSGDSEIEIELHLWVGKQTGLFFKKTLFNDPKLWEIFNYQPLSILYDKKKDNVNKYTDVISFIEKHEFISLTESEIEFLSGFNQIIYEYLDNVDERIKEDYQRKSKIKSDVIKIINSEFDKNKDGELDILEGDNLLLDLVEKNQSIIVDFDHKLIQNLMKLNKFLNTKKKNLNVVFDLLKTTVNQGELDEILPVIRDSIDNYQSMLIHSLNMVVSIKEKDMVTYYEIYETFDELGVFNSNWENEISEKLSKIDSKLTEVISSIKQLMVSISNMEHSISNKIDNLTYVTKSSYNKIHKSLNTELKTIRVGNQWNNLLNGIQTYQTYKINQNTKS